MSVVTDIVAKHVYRQGSVRMATALGDKIRGLRKERELTLDKLAELTGSSKSYIWELENKTPPRPSAEKLSRIADKLGVTIEYLLDTEAAVSEEDAEDAAFYRKYRRMDPSTKAKLRSLVDIWVTMSDEVISLKREISKVGSDR